MKHTSIVLASRCLFYASVMALLSSNAVAQTAASRASSAQPHEAAANDSILATPIGHEVDVSFGGYR
jgi:hypothetical protein